ncbi:MAG: hypothetical protein AVDCRST_MAG93-6696, partial [uncultured Chloroflexia bacterium]
CFIAVLPLVTIPPRRSIRVGQSPASKSGLSWSASYAWETCCAMSHNSGPGN